MDRCIGLFGETYYSDEQGNYEKAPPRRKLGKNEVPLMEVKSPCGYYHYTNDASQGALITQTAGFPDFINKTTHECHSAYSDRMASWDSKRFDQLCSLIGGGDGMWAYKLGSHTDQSLLELGKFAFKLGTLPEHVRFIHYYNVSSGYSCPVIEAIVRKKAPAPKTTKKPSRKIAMEMMEK